MQKTAVTVFGALLISGMAVQMAAASEHHHLTKAKLSRHHSDFRGAYNQINGPIGTAAYNGVGYYGNPYYQNAGYVAYGPYGAASCAQDQGWAYYDKASGKYMDNNGDWRPCR